MLPPPCQAVIVNQSASLGTSCGVTRMVACTVRNGTALTSCNETSAVSCCCARYGTLKPTASSRATRAPPTAKRPSIGGAAGRVAASSASLTRLSRSATQPPSVPAPTAATNAQGAPCGSTSAGQGRTAQVCDQANSEARPIVPMPTPATAPNSTARRVLRTSPSPSTTSAEPM